MSGLFAGLPRPRAGRLTVYGLGPGMGESVVVHLPDGLWMVVDGCVHEGLNLPLELLDALGQDDVDLLVITHPDLDHIRGLDAILDRKHVHAVWRYPKGTMVRDLLAAWLERTGPEADGRFATLFALHDAIERRIKRGDIEVAFGGLLAPRPWTGRADAYSVENFAPTTYDAERMGKQIKSALLELRRGGIEPTERLLAFLGDGRQWSDDPNVVSLALAITWGQTRLILGGDVLTGTRHRSSGWKGIIRWLAGGSRRPDRRGILRDPRWSRSPITAPRRGSRRPPGTCTRPPARCRWRSSCRLTDTPYPTPIRSMRCARAASDSP